MAERGRGRPKQGVGARRRELLDRGHPEPLVELLVRLHELVLASDVTLEEVASSASSADGSQSPTKQRVSEALLPKHGKVPPTEIVKAIIDVFFEEGAGDSSRRDEVVWEIDRLVTAATEAMEEAHDQAVLAGEIRPTLDDIVKLVAKLTSTQERVEALAQRCEQSADLVEQRDQELAQLSARARRLDELCAELREAAEEQQQASAEHRERETELQERVLILARECTNQQQELLGYRERAVDQDEVVVRLREKLATAKSDRQLMFSAGGG